MQFFLIQGRRAMAVFRSEFQAGDTSPHDALLPVSGPGIPFIGRTALPTYQEFREGVFGGVFAQLCLAVALHDLPLAGPASHFFLYSLEPLSWNDRRMIVLHIILWTLSIIFPHFFADTIQNIGLSQQGIPDVTLIGEDIMDYLVGPPLDTLCGGHMVRYQFPLNL